MLLGSNERSSTQTTAETPAATADGVDTPEVRACSSCGASLRADQDWCLECGVAADAEGRSSTGWRWPAGIITTVLVLAGGSSALAYHSISRDAHRTAIAALNTPPPAGPAIASAAPPSATAGTNGSGAALPPPAGLSAPTPPAAGGASPTPSPSATGAHHSATATPSGSGGSSAGAGSGSGSGATPAPSGPAPGHSHPSPTPSVPTSPTELDGSASWSTTGDSSRLGLDVSFSKARGGSSAPVQSVEIIVPSRSINSDFQAPSQLSRCSITSTNVSDDTLVCTGSLPLGQSAHFELGMVPNPESGMGGDLIAHQSNGHRQHLSISGP